MVPTRDVPAKAAVKAIMKKKKAVTPPPPAPRPDVSTKHKQPPKETVEVPVVRTKQQKPKEAVEARKTSPSVQRDRQMSARRESLKKAFTERREADAHELLADIVNENSWLHEEQKRLSEEKRVTSRSPGKGRRTALEERSSRDVEAVVDVSDWVVPKLSLEMSAEMEKECAEMVVRSKRPSLMTKTILGLERKQVAKHAETERLLRGWFLNFVAFSNY